MGCRRHLSLIIMILLFTKPKTHIIHIVDQPFSRVTPPYYIALDLNIPQAWFEHPYLVLLWHTTVSELDACFEEISVPWPEPATGRIGNGEGGSRVVLLTMVLMVSLLCTDEVENWELLRLCFDDLFSTNERQGLVKNDQSQFRKQSIEQWYLGLLLEYSGFSSCLLLLSF